MTMYDEFKRQISSVSDKTKTEIVKVGDGAGKNITSYDESEIADYDRRAKEIGVVYFDPRSRLANDPFRYFWEAGRCYILGYYIATISLSSAVVEYTWNADPRLKGLTFPQTINGWATLGLKNLLFCRENGLPIDELLEPEEIQNIETMKSNPKFIDIRNKIDHGEISAYFQSDLPAAYSKLAEQEAGSQLMKSQRYFVEWHNQLWK